MNTDVLLSESLDVLNTTKIMYDEKFQNRFLKILLDGKDDTFSYQIIDIIQEAFFDGSYRKSLVKDIKKYYDEYNAIPDYTTLTDIVKRKNDNNSFQEQVLETIKRIENQIPKDKAHVKDSSMEFCKRAAQGKHIADSVSLYLNGNYAKAESVMANFQKIGQQKSAGHSYVKDVEKRLIKKLRKPVSTMEGLNPYIGGGLAGGELGIVLAPTGGGKSMMLVKFACEAFKTGRKAVYYSFELMEESIGNRVDACLSDTELKSIQDYPDKIREVAQKYSANGADIIIREFGTGTASVNTLRSHLKLLERDGFVPDILFVDYIDIMKPIVQYSEKRFALTAISEELRGLAMERNIPIWTASQTGRSSFGKELFGVEDIAESIGKAQTADVIIGIGRTPEDKIERMATLNIMKNRNGEDGKNMRLHFDTTRIDIRVSSDSVVRSGMENLGAGIESQMRNRK